MDNNWLTKVRDIETAKKIMEEYALHSQSKTLGLFELVVNLKQKKMDFQLAKWVVALTTHFNHLYGATQGGIITKKVIASCMINGETLH